MLSPVCWTASWCWQCNRVWRQVPGPWLWARHSPSCRGCSIATHWPLGGWHNTTETECTTLVEPRIRIKQAQMLRWWRRWGWPNTTPLCTSHTSHTSKCQGSVWEKVSRWGICKVVWSATHARNTSSWYGLQLDLLLPGTRWICSLTWWIYSSSRRFHNPVIVFWLVLYYVARCTKESMCLVCCDVLTCMIYYGKGEVLPVATKKGLDWCKCLFNWIEIGRVRWKKDKFAFW